IITVNPQSGKYGDTITLIGNGYGSGTTVQIDFGTKQTITTTTSTLNGTFSCTFLVNTQLGNTRIITATDLGTPTLLYATSTFNVSGKIARVFPASGKIGSTVTIEGWGYDGTITVHFGITQTITTYIENQATFSVTFTVDSHPYGSKIITAKDIDTTGQQSSDTSVFIVAGRITLVSPPSGVVGSVVTVMGDGYGTTGTTIRIDFGTTQTITTTLVDNDNGTFSITFIVSTQAYDTRVITAYGPYSNYDTGIFYIRPKITLISPESGVVGASVTVEGVGYGGTTWCRIGFGTCEYVKLYPTPNNQKQTSGNGTFSQYFYVNTQPGGTTIVSLYHQGVFS
ncbi:MAG: hypothetical protein AAB296_05700, partial [Candidatus Desantisbacteria bacterium]